MAAGHEAVERRRFSQRSAVPANVAAAVLSPLVRIALWTTLLFCGSVIVGVGLVFLFGKGPTTPNHALSQALRNADISHDLVARTANDELSCDYNNFINKVREILRHTRKLGLEAAVGSTKVAGLVKALGAKSKKNAKLSDIGGSIHRDVEEMDHTIGNTLRHFAGLVGTFEDNKERLSGIAAAVDQVSSKNSVIHAQVVEIREVSNQVDDILTETAQSATSMNRRTEALLEAVSYFKIGNDPLEERISAVSACRDLVQSKIRDMARNGINVFDRNYQPVANTKPQNYRVAYDSYFDKELQPVFDAAMRDIEGVYCVVVDLNGYIATHNSQVSKPLTGDFPVDLIYSRDKRIYNPDETEIRRFKNTNPFLLQTYMRDTGEILNDLSMPIYVDGEHWGAIVAGFEPTKVMGSQHVNKHQN